MSQTKKKKCFLHKNVEDEGIGKCDGNLIARDSLSANGIRLLKVWTKCYRSIKHVCQGHQAMFLRYFGGHERACSDPLGDHKASDSANVNPPPKKKRKVAPKSLKEILPDLRDKAKLIGLYLIPGHKACVNCFVKLQARIKAAQLKLINEGKEIPTFASSPSVQSSQSVSTFVTPSPVSVPAPGADNQNEDEPFQENIAGLNTWLSSLGFSPISEKKLKNGKKYVIKVNKKIKAALSKYSQDFAAEDQNEADLNGIVEELKEYISNHAEPGKFFLALSVLPKSWSIQKIQEIFGVSNYLVRKCRSVVEKHGILTPPKPRAGRGISEETQQLITSFYLRDDISRPLPGSKDVLSVRENGQRVKKTKRLVLSTLGTLQSQFCEEFPNNPVSRAKFCELRPKECVLAGTPGTHVICVCVHHQNPVLMFEGANLKKSGLDSVKDCRKLLLCREPTVECYLRKCKQCPDSTALREHLEVYFDSEMITHVKYNQWESTDRGTIVPITKETDDFIYDFIALLEALITHDYITKMQSEFKKDTIQNLKEDEVVVNLDFAENFSFVVQDSSQGWYFNNRQATIHPCVINYKNQEGEACTSSFVLISDHMDHSTAAVNKFQKKLVAHIKEGRTTT